MKPTSGQPRIASECVTCGSRNLHRNSAILMPFVAHRVFGWEPVRIDESWGLRSISQGMAYSLCNTLHCEFCDLVFLDIRFDDREMAALYSGYRDEEYVALRDRYEPGYRERNSRIAAGVVHLDKIEDFLSPWLVNAAPRVLDWGGDTGINTPFRSRASALDIFDISDRPVIAGAAKVNYFRALEGHYDLIVSSHVLEHIPFPREQILEIGSVMKKDTVLYIEVPQEDLIRHRGDDPNFWLKKRHWHEHINFHSEASLRRLVEGCGLSVLSLETLSIVGGGSATHVFQLACRKS